MDNNQQQTSIGQYTKPSEVTNYHKPTVSNHLNHAKSHTYTGEQVAEMARRLNAIGLSMAFEKVNTPEVTLLLAQWIKDQFGDLSMQEVSQAFDLVTAKKIGSQIRHYNTFSKQYIGEVLNAFKEFKNKQMKLYKESEAQKLPEPKGATPKEMYEGIKKLAVEKGEVMKVANWTDAYNYAWKENLIHRMNEQERAKYKDSIQTAMESEKRGGIIEQLSTDIQGECHRRFMINHFHQMISTPV